MKARVTADDKSIICPLYQRRTQNSISCNGFCWPDSTIVQCYVKKQDLLIQLKVFCKEHYKKCELYRAVIAARFQEELDETV